MDSYWLEQVVGIISDDGTTGEISDIHTVSGNEMAMGFNPNKHCVRFDPLTTKKYGLFWHDWEDNNGSISKNIYKIPHIGWNLIKHKKISTTLNNIDLKQRFYFIHSYF